jgi:hypothetical protein
MPVIIETSIFTRQVQAFLGDDDYQCKQTVLAIHPDAGDLIPGGGGMRKIRGHSRSWKTWQRAGDLLLGCKAGSHSDAADVRKE